MLYNVAMIRWWLQVQVEEEEEKKEGAWCDLIFQFVSLHSCEEKADANDISDVVLILNY